MDRLTSYRSVLSQGNAFSVEQNKRDRTIDSYWGAEVHLSVRPVWGSLRKC